MRAVQFHLKVRSFGESGFFQTKEVSFFVEIVFLSLKNTILANRVFKGRYEVNCFFTFDDLARNLSLLNGHRCGVANDFRARDEVFINRYPNHMLRSSGSANNQPIKHRLEL